MTEAGLTPVQQAPADSVARLELGDAPPTEVWQALLEQRGVPEALVAAIRDLGRGKTVAELYAWLDEHDVPPTVATHVVRICRGEQLAALELVEELAPSLGSGWSSYDEALALADVFAALEDTPTLTVVVDAVFRERRRDHREQICALLARLAAGFDVRVVASTLTQRWLAEHHRADLPGVAEWCSTQEGRAPVTTLRERAREALPPEGTASTICQLLADEPAETLPYTALYSRPELGAEATVRSALGRLADLELVARFGPDSHRFVELTAAGRAYVDAVREHRAESERVDDTPNSSPQAVYSREHGKGGEAGPYRSRYLGRAGRDGAIAAAAAGELVLVDEASAAADRQRDRIRYVNVDERRGEVVVSVRATGAFQHTVSTALAMAGPRVIDDTLTNERLEQLDEPPAILRDARCIGALSDAALADPAALREAFIEWGEEIAELTREMQSGDCEDRDRLRGEIFRSALGLRGSLVHLFDAVGVDVVRELQVPNGLDLEDLQELANSLGMSAAIESRYRQFASYRQLFEPRTDKRENALSPSVDAADPTGDLIGSLVVRGSDLHRLRPFLEGAVAAPRELHEDAPEFSVPVTVADAGRSATATAAGRVLGRKNLGLTPAAVSVLDALLASPHDVAEALETLGEEDTHRDVTAHDLRYALSTVDADHLVPDLPRTVGAVLAELLGRDERISQRELADAIDCSTQSLRNNRDALEALGLVSITEDGWRLELSFATSDERHSGRYPDPVSGEPRVVDVVSDVLAAVLPPSEYADPGGSVHQALSSHDLEALTEETDLRPWLAVASGLVDEPLTRLERTVAMGEPTAQQPIAGVGPTEQPAD